MFQTVIIIPGYVPLLNSRAPGSFMLVDLLLSFETSVAVTENMVQFGNSIQSM